MSQISGGSESGLASLIASYQRLSADGEPLVLATVVETRGSTYRKAGARMLISRSGQFYGLIGGGCFEGDLYEQTQAVFSDGEPRLLFYDMQAPEDALWGLGLGCNGAVRILLQRLQADGHDPTMLRLQRVLASDAPALLMTICQGPQAGTSILAEEADAFDTPGSDRLQAVHAESRAVTALEQPALVEHQPGFTVFYDYIRPAPRLLLIGAGADAMPILNLARQLDWRVLLVDHRPAYARPERFPGAEAVLEAAPADLQTQLAGRRIDAAVLMTHNIHYDARYLEVLAGMSYRYLGLLGPRARRDELFRMTGIDAAVFGDRLHAPVGLDIGGASPESIALSLVTEIHAVLQARDARPLRDKRQPIQSREPAN